MPQRPTATEIKMARFRQGAAPPQATSVAEAAKPPKRPWLSIWNEELWERLD